jgi:hypothetical protein
LLDVNVLGIDDECVDLLVVHIERRFERPCWAPLWHAGPGEGPPGGQLVDLACFGPPAR